MKTEKTFTRNWFLNLFPADVSSTQVKDGFREKLLRAPIFKVKNEEIIFRIPRQLRTTVKGLEVEHLINSLINELARIFEAEVTAEKDFSTTSKKLIWIRENLSACQTDLLRHGVREDEIKKIGSKIERWRNRISKDHDANGALRSRTDLIKHLYAYFQIHTPELSQDQIIYSLAGVFSALGEEGSISRIRDRIKRQFFRHDKPTLSKGVGYAQLPPLWGGGIGTSNIPPKK